MRSEIKVSTLSEVYILIIEKTAESLKNYLKINKKKTGRFDIVNELKKRWKTRINFLIDSMNGSWSNLQNSCDLKRNIVMKNLRLIFLTCLVLPLMVFAQKNKKASQVAESLVEAELFSGLKWRNIGPFRGGRSVTSSGVVGDPTLAIVT